MLGSELVFRTAANARLSPSFGLAVILCVVGRICRRAWDATPKSLAGFVRAGRPPSHGGSPSQKIRTLPPRRQSRASAVLQVAARGDPARTVRPRHGVDRLRHDDGRRPGPPRARVPERVPRGAQLGAVRDGPGRQEGAPGRPDRRREPDPRRFGRHLLEREASRGRDRGPALLHPQGSRLPRHRTGALGGPAAPACGAGCLDDHAAVREERTGRAEEPLALPEAQGGRARLPARAQVDQGEDPHRVPEHGLLRRGRLRDRVRGARLLRLEPPRVRAPVCGRPRPGRGCPAGRDDRFAGRLQPGPESISRHRPAQPGAAANARADADHHERADGGGAPGAPAARPDPDAEEDQPRPVLHRVDRGPAR